MGKRQWALQLCSVSISLAACGGSQRPGPAVIPPGFTTCADFPTPPYNDDQDPGVSLTEALFVFDDPTDFQFINQNTPGGALGLQFPAGGLKITLPVAATVVSLDIGGYASGITIDGLNSSGTSVTANSLTADNTIHNVLLGGPDLKTISLVGGDNEGILERICIK